MYVVAHAYDVPELVQKYEPAAINGFDVFCDKYLGELILKRKRSGIGPIVAKLAKAWKEQSVRTEKDTLGKTVHEREQSLAGQLADKNRILAGKDQEIKNLTRRLASAKDNGKIACSVIREYAETLGYVISVIPVSPINGNASDVIALP